MVMRHRDKRADDYPDHPCSSYSDAALLWAVMGHWDRLVKGNIINQSRQPDIKHRRDFQRGNHSHSGLLFFLSPVCSSAP